MRIERVRRAGGKVTIAAAALLSAAALAGSGQAEAVTHQGRPAITASRASAAQTAGVASASKGPGYISTVAGGVGGPAAATTVDVSSPCGVSYSAGQLYVAGHYAVRDVNTQTDYLTTPVGTALNGLVHLGGLATAASGVNTCGAAADQHGNLVMAIPAPAPRVVVAAAVTGTFYGKAMTAGHIYSVAGTGAPGYSGDGGPATAAELHCPAAVATDSAGNLVIADSCNSRIRVVAEHTGTYYGQAMTTGDIYTVAGDGTAGYSGDGGPATSAELNGPVVTIDGAGNLVIADMVSNVIRVVAEHTGTYYGQAMTTGDIYTVAGDGTAGYSGDGGPATQAQFDMPQSVAVDGSGNLLIADASNCRVRVVAVSKGTFYGQAMTAGDVYTVAGTGTRGYSGDGGPAAAAELGSPSGVSVDGAGNLVIADIDNSRVRVVAATTGTYYGKAMAAGNIYTVAGVGGPVGSFTEYSGDKGPATHAELWNPEGVAVDGAGNLLIADTYNNRIRVVAASTGAFYGVKMTAGNLYTVAGVGSGASGTFGGAATKFPLEAPSAVALDAAGNLLANYYPYDRLVVVPNATGTYYGKSMTAGHIYSIAGNGIQGFSGDGGSATKAELAGLAGMTVDGAGNVLLGTNGRIRVVAARAGTFYGKKMAAGHIYTIAGGGSGGLGDGGPATAAEICNPGGVAVDSAGDVLVADTCNNRIRVVAAKTGTVYGQAMTTGDIYTIAGGGSGGLGDGSPATAAEILDPGGVAVDQAGNVLITDTFDNRVRVVPVQTGTYYGHAMTADDIYTIAGGGCCNGNQVGYAGFTGDGGLGTKAETDNPAGIAVDGSGLVFADARNNRIRMVNG